MRLAAGLLLYLYVAVNGSDAANPERAVQLLVFDTGSAHHLIRRVPLWPAAASGDAETVRGIAAHAGTRRLFISTTRRLAAIDLSTNQVVWEKKYDGHCCDRLAVSPDGRTIYAPAFGSPKWYVVSAATGELRASIDVTGWPRDTVYSSDGRQAYLSAWESSTLSVSDATSHEIVKRIGPFSASLCPFTVNAGGTL